VGGMTDEPQTVVAAGSDVLTLMNTFTCADQRQNELVAALEKATVEVFSGLDGFISANLHASLDRTRVVNYVQWRSVEDFDAAQVNPEVRKHAAEIMAIAESADPRLYEVRSVHHG
jgi:heme-degrading monooxygenase HmoA